MIRKNLFFISLMLFSSLSYAIHYSDKEIIKEMSDSTLSMQTDYNVCSGVLIKKNVILTAKHCFKSLYESDMFINTYLEGANKPKITRVKSSEIEKHPQYDLALVYLRKPLESAKPSNFLESLQTTFSKRRLMLAPGQVYCALGAGRNEKGDNDLNILGQSCYREIYKSDAISNLFFTFKPSNNNNAVDMGDSGGPVFARFHGKTFLTGIISGITYENEKNLAGAVDLFDEDIQEWIKEKTK